VLASDGTGVPGKVFITQETATIVAAAYDLSDDFVPIVPYAKELNVHNAGPNISSITVIWGIDG
jgi:hypothetical protein